MRTAAVSAGGDIVTVTMTSDSVDTSVTFRMSPEEAEKTVLRLLLTLAALKPLKWQGTYDSVQEKMR